MRRLLTPNAYAKDVIRRGVTLELEKREKRAGLLALRGRLKFDVDLEKSRK